MTPEQFCAQYPRLYHMAEAGSWPSIEQHGLRSTSALLDLFEVTGPGRERLESQQRHESVVITHPVHGMATIRDQKPLPESKLRQCLHNLTPQQWYKLLNGKVFFWSTKDRVEELLRARAYRGRTHTVLTVDSRELLRRHVDRITLSRINSGAAIYQPTPRGADTFRSLSDWPAARRPRSGNLSVPIKEVAVEYCVPDIAEIVVSHEERIA
jgi:hypothetical protein